MKLTLRHYAFALACIAVPILLSACSTSKRADNYYPVTRGGDYQPAAGDRTECMASWYGKDFHGRPTASGEIYDMYGMTCAHRDYPLGTRIKVTNVSNGKDVECIINDRGPFVPGRDLDMSYGAARQIDLIGPGVGRVRIEVLGREQRYQKEVRYGKTGGGAVTIQTGSFRDEENARKLKMGLDLHYKDVYIMKVLIGGEHYFRVRMGRFKDRGDALKTAEPLAREGYDVLITKYEKSKENN